MEKNRRSSGADLLGQAMDAHRSGRLAEADRLYRSAIAADPGDAQALRLRGVLARESGDLEASAQLLGRAADVATHDAEPLAELSVTRMAAGDLAGAEVALRTARRRDPQHLKSLANLGALLQYRGHVRAAIECYRELLVQDPDDAEIRCNLAKALVDAGEGEQALGVCDEGLAAAPGHPLLLATQGAVLCDLDRFEQAVGALESATLRYPDDDMAFVNLAYARSRLADHARAITALRSALLANPDNGRATADLVNELAGTGSMAHALELADRFLAAHPGERQVLAAQAFTLRDAGRGEEADALVDLQRLIHVSDIPAPRGYAIVAEFNAELCRLVEADSSLLASPLSKSTRGGGQTGEIDLQQHPAMAAFAEIVDAAVRSVARQWREGGLAAHPAMANAAPTWTLRAWGTVLPGGGYQSPHIHPLGWLSGVYYAQVPVDMGSSGPQSGWVEFGTPPERFLVTKPPDTRAIEPRAGRLVLFPSYFYHRTLPFDSRQRRISIAFDVMPQGRMRRPERL